MNSNTGSHLLGTSQPLHSGLIREQGGEGRLLVLGGHSWYAEARVTTLVVWTESSSLWILLLSRWDLLLCDNSCHVVPHKLSLCCLC